MRNVLVIGAGKSSSYLIDYLQKKSRIRKFTCYYCRCFYKKCYKRAGSHKKSTALEFDVFNDEQRRSEIQKADIVVSMLPARFHIEVAKDCVEFGKHMVTASYISEEMKALDEDVKRERIGFYE